MYLRMIPEKPSNRETDKMASESVCGEEKHFAVLMCKRSIEKILELSDIIDKLFSKVTKKEATSQEIIPRS